MALFRFQMAGSLSLWLIALLLGMYGGQVYAAGLDLGQVLRQVEDHNPELAGLSAKADAASFDVTAEPILPPPVFQMDWMGTDGPLASEGRMQTSYRFKQEFIFPSKFLARKDALSKTSEGAVYARRARLLELLSETKSAYVDYWSAQEKVSLLEQRSQVILEHSKRLRSATLSNKIQQAHIVSADTDYEVAQAEIEEAKQGLVVARGVLNTLMGKDANDELPQATAPAISPLPARDVDSASTIARHPKILSLSSEVAASEGLRSAARAEYFPNFMVEYWYNRRLDNTPNTSELMVGVTVPFLYFWQPRAMTQAAGARVIEKEAALTQAKNEFRLKLLKSYANLSSLRAQSLSYENKVLPSAARRLKISHGLAPTDMESLNEHRESLEGEISVRLKALELRASFEKALAEYDALIAQSASKGAEK